MAEVKATLDESQRQMTLLALAELALSRPGMNQALGEIADKLYGRDMFEEFKRCNADRVKATHKPFTSQPPLPTNVDSAQASRHNREFPDPKLPTKEIG